MICSPHIKHFVVVHARPTFIDERESENNEKME